MKVTIVAYESVRRVLFVAVILAAGVGLVPHSNSESGQVFIVSNYRGGLVRHRANEIAWLRNSRQHVEIRLSRCMSSCTMYLGAGDVCINPSTTFGFHGPTYYGQALSPDRFEYWSRLIASHYPEPLARWFMETGRYKTTGYYRIKGNKIIQMGGYPTCK
ncbi:MAG: hypothetical protein HRU33_21040 [Rhodobacteraceae bacterium]|nr:hypothetical protein [Paracoccaceae bacterium]